MEQHLPINERSFIGQAITITDADQLLSKLAIVLRELMNEARRRGVQPVVYSSSDLAMRSCLTNDHANASFYMLINKFPSNRDARLLLQKLLTNSPYSEKRLVRRILQHRCIIVATGEDVTDSSVAAAAAFGGWLISMQGCANYPDGSLEVHYSETDQLELPHSQLRNITHCVEHPTARQLRRRYVPNAKHHPNKFKGHEWELITDRGAHSPMPLDVDYDSMGPNRETELRDLRQDPPNHRAQQLLDGAIGDPEKNQLYAISYDPQGREIFFEFQYDGLRGYHGYLVSAASVPHTIRENLRSRSSTR